ncbi:CBS domain-containing protein [Streptomyces triculaminicus]|uniref:CBS domain-containing protein n=1 Tax=Streptomyces triculaminicus TaxID=2816232 RepID=UPI0033E26E4E
MMPPDRAAWLIAQHADRQPDIELLIPLLPWASDAPGSGPQRLGAAALHSRGAHTLAQCPSFCRAAFGLSPPACPYAAPVTRRGVRLTEPGPGLRLAARTVADVMTPAPASVPATSTLPETARLLSASGRDALPVLHHSGRHVGVVSARRVAEALARHPAGCRGESV